jgi:hypothetical protein
MRRMIKVLAVAALVATILMASTSPALAKVLRGGVLLHTSRPCEAQLDVQKAQGSPLLLNPEGRAPGCWVELPSSATQDD